MNARVSETHVLKTRMRKIAGSGVLTTTVGSGFGYRNVTVHITHNKEEEKEEKKKTKREKNIHMHSVGLQHTHGGQDTVTGGVSESSVGVSERAHVTKTKSGHPLDRLTTKQPLRVRTRTTCQWMHTRQVFILCSGMLGS